MMFDKLCPERLEIFFKNGMEVDSFQILLHSPPKKLLKGLYKETVPTFKISNLKMGRVTVIFSFFSILKLCL